LSNVDSNKIRPVYEYFSCDETQETSSFQNSQINCGLQNGKCILDSNTKIFDYLIESDECVNDKWSGSRTKINEEIKQNIPNSYYETNSIKKFCTQSQDAQSIQKDGKVCKNAVKSVQYVIFVRSGRIERILGRILYSNVNFNSFLKQMFEVKWAYLPDVSTDKLNLNQVMSLSKYDDFLTSQSYLKTIKSGIKGYRIGKPLITGVSNGTDMTEDNFDISYNKRVSAFKILKSDRLCGTNSKSERQLIEFNRNLTSNCVVQVAKQDLNSVQKCECLRRVLFTKLNDYFAPSNYLSKNGNPNFTKFSTDDWLKVFPSIRPLKLNDYSFLNNNQSSTGLDLDNLNYKLCMNVPHKIHVWFFFLQSGYFNGESLNEIIGSYISYSYKNWTIECKPNEKCDENLAREFRIDLEVSFINKTE
jgi:hypothetical protein